MASPSADTAAAQNPWTYAEAYRSCADVVRARAKNFYWALAGLPAAKRRALYAVYTYCRFCDDMADEEMPDEVREKALVKIAENLREACKGQPQSAAFAAIADTIACYDMPMDYFDQVLSGVGSDLLVNRYETHMELYDYCFRVASVVGLMCLEVFGYEDEIARDYAVELGQAMQWTNILRDVAEDAALDRIYIPIEELHKFGLTEEDILERRLDDRFRKMMAAQVARTRELFAGARRLIPLVQRRSRYCPAALAAIYQGVLDRIEAADYDVYTRRIELPRGAKRRIAIGTWLRYTLLPA